MTCTKMFKTSVNCPDSLTKKVKCDHLTVNNIDNGAWVAVYFPVHSPKLNNKSFEIIIKSYISVQEQVPNAFRAWNERHVCKVLTLVYA